MIRLPTTVPVSQSICPLPPKLIVSVQVGSLSAIALYFIILPSGLDSIYIRIHSYYGCGDHGFLKNSYFWLWWGNPMFLYWLYLLVLYYKRRWNFSWFKNWGRRGALGAEAPPLSLFLSHFAFLPLLLSIQIEKDSVHKARPPLCAWRT